MITAAPHMATSIPKPTAAHGRVRESLLLAAAVFALLIGFELYLDNTFIINANGLWKSVYVRMWADNPATAPVDFSNLLYFPVYGLLCRVLDGFGIYGGQTWRQMAFLNAGFAAAGVGLVYLWISSASGSRRIALLTSVFYLGTGFFLALAVINEDIMPSYVWTLAGMMLAGLWFGRPSGLRIVLVALVVSVGWLFEWRLMFPVVPPMLLALVVSAPRWQQGIARVVLFLSGSLLLPLLLTSSLMVRGTCGRALECMADMLWTGKGIDTGWAGFSLMKARLAWVGISQSLIGGRFIGSDFWYRHPAHLFEVGTGSALLILLAVLAWRQAWARRTEPSVVSHVIVFAGTFLAGEVFNLYSQPHDPQMQLTVMPWVIPAAAVLFSHLVGIASTGTREPRGFRERTLRRVAAFGLCLLPLCYNASVLARSRGGDAQYLSLLSTLDQRFNAASTVFLYRGFEFVVPWKWATWSASNPGVDALTPAPQPAPKFKWISVAEVLIRHPKWSAERKAADIAGQVEKSLQLGYQVVAGEMWGESEERCIDQLSTVGPAGHIKAMHDELNRQFAGELLYVDPVAGPFFRITRRPSAPQ